MVLCAERVQSLSCYAKETYTYAIPETMAYISTTVLTPLGLDMSYLSLFALPPCTTNIRRVGTLRPFELKSIHTHTCHACILEDWGMPHCLAIVPQSVMNPMECEAHDMTTPPTNSVLDAMVMGPLVMVDVGCAEAVLRGSDVFRPGVRSVIGSVSVGTIVQVGYLGRDGLRLCVGEGVACMDRRTLLQHGNDGTAVHVRWTPKEQIPKSQIVQMLRHSNINHSHAMECEHAASVEEEIFLQNYSSMAAVGALVQRLRSDVPLTLLDACAAPGGKASLLLSLLLSRGHTLRQLTCCERSRTRFTKMIQLLEHHFGVDFITDVVYPFGGDVNKLQQDGRYKGETVFDGILLDPPCSGLGLRPKLCTHTMTPKHIHDAADYQRKLFDTCVRMLRRDRSSVLVYSTCTITLDENEANVLWALQTFPQVRLARAETVEEKRLCALSVTNCGGRRFLLEEEIHAAQRWNEEHVMTSKEVKESESPLMVLRFMPREEYDSVYEDSVGFFMAVFVCNWDERGVILSE